MCGIHSIYSDFYETLTVVFIAQLSTYELVILLSL